MKKAKILICDDDPGVRESLELILGEEYQLAFAANGEEAIHHVRTHHPDLAILDIKMPKMNGIEAIQKIRRLTPRTRVLVLTGYESIDVATEAAKLGAVNYLTKPLDRAKLLAEVHFLLTQEKP